MAVALVEFTVVRSFYSVLFGFRRPKASSRHSVNIQVMTEPSWMDTLWVKVSIFIKNYGNTHGLIMNCLVYNELLCMRIIGVRNPDSQTQTYTQKMLEQEVVIENHLEVSSVIN